MKKFNESYLIKQYRLRSYIEIRVMIDQKLLEKLRCPFSGSKLIAVGEELISADPKARYLYSINHGIPILLKGSAVQLSELDWNNKIQKSASNGTK